MSSIHVLELHNRCSEISRKDASQDSLTNPRRRRTQLREAFPRRRRRSCRPRWAVPAAAGQMRCSVAGSPAVARAGCGRSDALLGRRVWLAAEVLVEHPAEHRFAWRGVQEERHGRTKLLRVDAAEDLLSRPPPGLLDQRAY